MTYISDIFINLNSNLFEFYEWNKKDYIEHIKKIPIIKTNNKTYKDICQNNIQLNQLFVNKYALKAEKYNSNKYFNYLAITNGCNAIAIYFNTKGNILKKSSFIFEDEEIICQEANKMKSEKIAYTIIKKNKYHNLTRLENEIKNDVIKNIKKISSNQLKYLYYDCFNTKEDNISIITRKILNSLKNDNVDVIIKSNNLFKLIYQQNK